MPSASSTPRSRRASTISATVPETCGVAIEVPLSDPYSPFGRAESTSTPGAETSGTTYDSGHSAGASIQSVLRTTPPQENSGTSSPASVAPTDTAS